MESISLWQQKNRWLYRGLPSASGFVLVDALALGPTIGRLLRVENVDASNMAMAD